MKPPRACLGWVVACCLLLPNAALPAAGGLQSQVDLMSKSQNKTEPAQNESKSRDLNVVVAQNNSQGVNLTTAPLVNPVIAENVGAVRAVNHEAAIGQEKRVAKKIRKTIKRRKVVRRRKSKKSSSTSSKRVSEMRVRLAAVPGEVPLNRPLPRTSRLRNLLPLSKAQPSVGNLTVANISNATMGQVLPTALNPSLEGSKQINSTVPVILSQNIGNLGGSNSSQPSENQNQTNRSLQRIKSKFFLIREPPTKKPTNHTLRAIPKKIITQLSKSRSTKRKTSHVSKSSTVHETNEVIVYEYDFTNGTTTKKPKIVRKPGEPRFFLIREASTEKPTPAPRPKIVPRRIVSKVSKTQKSSTSTNSTSSEVKSDSKQIVIKGVVTNNSGNATSLNSETASKNVTEKAEANSSKKGESVASLAMTDGVLGASSQTGTISNAKKTKNLRKSMRKVSRKVSKKKKSKVSKKSTSKNIVNTVINSNINNL